MVRMTLLLLVGVFTSLAWSQDDSLLKIRQALLCDSALIGFNEVGSFHEYWQDFHMVRRSPSQLSVSWENDKGDKRQSDLPQRDLDKFVEQLVAFVPVEYSTTSSTFTMIYIRSACGEYEYYYDGAYRGRRSVPAVLIRTLGVKTRLQHR